MSSAERLLISYGTIVLIAGFVLGTVLGMLRMRSPVIRTLNAAHVETLMQAAMHLGLAFAFGAVGFTSTAAMWAAVLLVVGSAMQAIGATLNWTTHTRDQFAERSPGWILNSLSTFVSWPGLILAAWGILTHL